MKIDKNDLINLFVEGYLPEDIAFELSMPEKDLKIIVSNIVKSLINQCEYKDAEVFCDAYRDDPIIQSQKIKLLMETGRNKQALRIGERPEFKDIETIQSQVLSILRKAIKDRHRCKQDYAEEFKKAKSIAERFPKNDIIQSKFINILNDLHMYDAVIKMAYGNPAFESNGAIQFQLMVALINKKRMSDAILVGDGLADNPKIAELLDRIQASMCGEDLGKYGAANRRESDDTYDNMDGTEMRKNIERIVRLSNPYEFINKKVPNWFDQVTLKAAVLDYKKADTPTKKRLIQEISRQEIDDPNLQESVRKLIAQIRKGSRIVDYDAYISLLKDSSKARFWRHLSGTLDDWEEELER